MIVGCARTSTADQTAGLEAQDRDLRAAGAERVYAERVSSVGQRGALKDCLGFLREGDALMVTKPNRLARNTAELLALEADLTKRGIGLVVLSMGEQRLDTRNPTSKLLLTILAGVATWEREIMLERQREGIAAAKAGGSTRAGLRRWTSPGCGSSVWRGAASTGCWVVRRLKGRRATSCGRAALWLSADRATGQNPRRVPVLF